jgi:hypothetical protein
MIETIPDVEYVWHQPDLRPQYESPEFYQPGSVVTITRGPVSIVIDRDGEADYVLTSEERPGWSKRLRTPDEFRTQYSVDADLPTDDGGVLCAIEHNPWFDLYPGNEACAGDSLDGVAHDLSEAIDDAIDRLG